MTVNRMPSRLTKFVLFFFGIPLFTIIATELIITAIFVFTQDLRYSRNELSKKLLTVGNGEESILGISSEQYQNKSMTTVDTVVHPYVGYVYDPALNPAVNRLGWLGELPTKNDTLNAFVIGITGGSFAESVYAQSKEVFINQIQKSHRDKFGLLPIQIINFSGAGYKQPQQLLALTYLLSLGYKFDAVINIDGFNEMVLPYVENRQFGVYPYYPRMWNFTSTKVLSKLAMKDVAMLESERTKRRKIADNMRHTLFQHSVAALIVWNYFDSIAANRILKLNLSLEKAVAAGDKSYQRKGPSEEADQDENVFIDGLIEMWAEASVQMGKIADANNFLYLHVLQPNQYVTGTKQFSSVEKLRALTRDEVRDSNFPFKNAVEIGYPRLIRRGVELGGLEKFLDLTNIYKNEKQTVYIDTCCHVNKLGSDYIAQELTKELSRYIK